MFRQVATHAAHCLADLAAHTVASEAMRGLRPDGIITVLIAVEDALEPLQGIANSLEKTV
eukprot:CAMPEP_0180714466 /NCGR_PEP_ID=MMETSP1038_2-20121128/12436_1 /TAXON_ID=632150 /ORGANISM="Azadinium spinosum, Strain 3D9" /LENGTH=59 /DNA_ID=CAMNT_0022746831 /DNA_START=470 /DNA_END=649 /DNA_ORIENTATION=+